MIAFQSPGGDVSGYMIYYQTEGGPVISDKVSGGERETLTGWSSERSHLQHLHTGSLPTSTQSSGWTC